MFGEAIIMIPKIDIVRAHELSDKIEVGVKKRFGIERFMIHLEPYKGEKWTAVIPVNNKNKDIYKLDIANNFGRAKYLAILKFDKNGKVLSSKLIDNPYLSKKVRAGLATSKMVEKYHPDIVLIKNIGEISFHTLRDALIEVYKLPEDVKTVKDAIQKFVEGSVLLLEKPTTVKEKGEK